MPSDHRAAPSADLPITLVVGTDDWAIEQAAAELAAAGHEVMRCQDPAAAAFPCFGVTTQGGCPLDRGAQVALAVRHRSAVEPTPHEMGVVCALHRGVPVVAAGMINGAPYAPFATVLVDQNGDPATACQAAAHNDARDDHGALEQHTDAEKVTR